MISNNYGVLVYGRNEAVNIWRCLHAINEQSIKPKILVYLDDGSTDHSRMILEVLKHEIDFLYPVYLRDVHESYVGDPRLSSIVNSGLYHLFKHWDKNRFDSFLINGADIIWSSSYVEDLIREMNLDPLLVACSGEVKGEHYDSRIPRGAGRIYHLKFWRKFIGYHPPRYIWESYPIYKALSLGFHVRAFSGILMYPLRSTTLYKSKYGVAMRELGYFPFYALLKCARAYQKNRKIGKELFRSYLTSVSVYDREIQRYVRKYQIERLMEVFRNKFTSWIWTR